VLTSRQVAFLSENGVLGTGAKNTVLAPWQHAAAATAYSREAVRNVQLSKVAAVQNLAHIQAGNLAAAAQARAAQLKARQDA
jgi:hypothetical protein